ncbi:MAG: pyrroline-5-carboxylate reductase [Bacilli bacterium]
MKKYGILGVGKMGSAILQGMMDSSNYSKNDILLCVRNSQQKEELESENYHVTSDISSFFNEVEIIILCIKPQGFDDVMKIASLYSYSNRCVVSIAAGITLSYLEKYFKDASLIRAMPSTPSLIKQGVTTIAYKKESKYIQEVESLFAMIGKTYRVSEEELDNMIPLNGSMPAYLFYFAKSFIECAVNEYHIPYEKAKEICGEAIISSCKLMLNSSSSLDTLISNVCSKGGTTIAGLDHLIKDKVDESLSKCYIACVKRGKELAK